MRRRAAATERRRREDEIGNRKGHDRRRGRLRPRAAAAPRPPALFHSRRPGLDAGRAGVGRHPRPPPPGLGTLAGQGLTGEAVPRIVRGASSRGRGLDVAASAAAARVAAAAAAETVPASTTAAEAAAASSSSDVDGPLLARQLLVVLAPVAAFAVRAVLADVGPAAAPVGRLVDDLLVDYQPGAVARALVRADR